MRTSEKRLFACLSIVVLLGVISPLWVFGYPQVPGYPNNPNEMDAFPYYSRALHLFTHPDEDRGEFVPVYSEDEWGTRYIDWTALENIDMRTLDFRVQLQTNEDIFNWMEPVYLTATITGSDLDDFPELKWRVQGLDTIADEGMIVVSSGVGRSTARQILPNPYITHLVFYLYFPSGQVHTSSHPIEIGNRPLTPREVTGIASLEGKIDESGKENVLLPSTFDPITSSLIGVLALISSCIIFVTTARFKVKR